MASITQHATPSVIPAARHCGSEPDGQVGAVDCGRVGERARRERSLHVTGLMRRGAAAIGAFFRSVKTRTPPPAPTTPSTSRHTAITGAIYHILPVLAFMLLVAATSPGRADSNGGATEALMTDIIAWISSNLDLPAVSERPRLEFVPPTKMAELRYRGPVTVGQSQSAAPADEAISAELGQNLGGLYSDARRTIYLPDGWSASTPGQVSVLVHEMVHHLQNLAGVKYACQQERERPAYIGQDRWLRLSGSSLEEEFGIGGMTLLVRTRCLG